MGTITTTKNGSAMIDGLVIVNAAKPLSLNITREDIKSARRKQPSCCVVAQALKRDIGAIEARVHLSRCFIRLEDKPEVWVRLMTPLSLRTNIIAYDRGGLFELGEFVFVPLHKNESARYGKKQSQSKLRNTPKKTKRRHAPIHVMTGIRKGAMAR